MKIKTSKPLYYATPGSAAVDLCAIEDVEIIKDGCKTINTGVRIEIPLGYVGLVCSRSGLAAKHNVFVLNAPGVIDSDYRGEIGVILRNLGSESISFKAGDRIAQLMIMPVPPAIEWVVDDNHSETERGNGGFGSTGT